MQTPLVNNGSKYYKLKLIINVMLTLLTLWIFRFMLEVSAFLWWMQGCFDIEEIIVLLLCGKDLVLIAGVYMNLNEFIKSKKAQDKELDRPLTELLDVKDLSDPFLGSAKNITKTITSVSTTPTIDKTSTVIAVKTPKEDSNVEANTNWNTLIKLLIYAAIITIIVLEGVLAFSIIKGNCHSETTRLIVMLCFMTDITMITIYLLAILAFY